MADIPLDLVIRFSTSNPDVPIPVASPKTTTGLALKQLIREHLSAPASGSRLRLIHAGKVLSNSGTLSRSIALTLPPPARDDGGAIGKTDKAKGKEPIRPVKPIAVRVYIHCSIGDALSASDLAAELRDADEAEEALRNEESASTTHETLGSTQDRQNASSTTPAPRGFDRLFTAGFTAAEVAVLRTQFLAIQAHTHTPDAMPSGADLLALEERWLDNGSDPATAAAGDAGGFVSTDAGELDDMLYGTLIGFFWPIGAMFWMMREEGVWTTQRQNAILAGFLANLLFGFVKATVR